MRGLSRGLIRRPALGVLAGVVSVSGCVMCTWTGLLNTEYFSVIIIGVVVVLLFCGGFSWLDHLNKIMMTTLALATFLAFRDHHDVAHDCVVRHGARPIDEDAAVALTDEDYRVGISPPSFDKQYVRDYLETLDWNKTAPGPHLPEEVIRRTAEKYREALKRLTA